MDSPKLMTVAETSVFRRKASELLDEEERNALIDFLADNPEAGDLARLVATFKEELRRKKERES